jgi:ribosomal protein L37E
MVPLDEFIKRSNEVHKNYYDYSLVKYNSVKDNVTIICPKHGQFKQIANSHLAGHTCRKCGTDKSAKTRKAKNSKKTGNTKKPVNNKQKTTEQFIKEAQEIHGDNYNYDEVVYTNCKTNVKITCNGCGTSFHQPPSVHLAKKGCKPCSIKKNSKKQMMTQEEFIKRANEVHENKYD